jgi:hypothetical protein
MFVSPFLVPTVPSTVTIFTQLTSAEHATPSTLIAHRYVRNEVDILLSIQPDAVHIEGVSSYLALGSEYKLAS